MTDHPLMQEDSLSLSQLLGRVGGVLRKEFSGSTWLKAEILEMNINRSGHCYLELVEKEGGSDALLARSRATIWASRFRSLRPYFESSTGMPLKSGIKVLCRVNLDFHSLYGFSINITDIDPSYTLGDLAQKKMEVIRRLKEEGVMDMNRGLPFPRVPQRIAVISSDTAAGYGDFMDSLHANSQAFRFHTRLFQATMQGDEAPGSIISALERIFAEADDFDCLVLIRGGGSRADLECFNDYDLAYHLSQFPLPVLTGIGHERDESVADLVAARGLKTPTAVAEFLLERMLSFEFSLSGLGDRLSVLVSSRVGGEKTRLEKMQLRHAMLTQNFLRKQRESIQGMASRLALQSTGLVERERQELRHRSSSLEKYLRSTFSRERDRLRILEIRSQGADPERILRKGYSIALHGGRVLSDARQLRPGDILETRLHRGTVWSRVEKNKDNE